MRSIRPTLAVNPSVWAVLRSLRIVCTNGARPRLDLLPQVSKGT